MIGMAVYRGMLVLLKRKKCAIVLAALVIICYGAMTGFGVATRRAVIMMLVSYTAVLIGRTYDMLSAASLSAILILAFHPLEIRNSGFLLSFGAILGISVVYPALHSVLDEELQKKKRSLLVSIAKPFLLSASIQLVTFPVVLNSFYEYPSYSILLNLIVIPLVSLLAGLSMAAGLVGSIFIKAGAVFAGGIYVILELYEKLAVCFLKLPFSTVVTGKPQISYFILYYFILIGTLLLWNILHSKKVWLCLLFLLFLPILPKNPGLMVTFVDVGQGDGIYFQTKENVDILVDGGSSNKKKLASFTLEPFLKSQGCKELDYVFISHLDDDHISGIMQLIDNMENGGIKIKTIVFGEGVVRDDAFEKVMKKITIAGIRICGMKREQSIELGKLKIRSIHPGKTEEGESDRNEASLALEVFYDEISFLLTGDMGAAENEAAKFLDTKEYTFLKVGHHGSNGSSSELFLEKVNPEYAIISCASKNRYGHPGKEATERLKKAGCKIFYTMSGGAVIVCTDGKKFTLDYFKDNL